MSETLSIVLVTFDRELQAKGTLVTLTVTGNDGGDVLTMLGILGFAVHTVPSPSVCIAIFALNVFWEMCFEHANPKMM